MRGQPVIFASSRLRLPVSMGAMAARTCFLTRGVTSLATRSRNGSEKPWACSSQNRYCSPGLITPPRMRCSRGFPMAVTARRFQTGLRGNRYATPDSHMTSRCIDSTRWNAVEPHRPVPTMKIGLLTGFIADGILVGAAPATVGMRGRSRAWGSAGLLAGWAETGDEHDPCPTLTVKDDNRWAA